MAPEPFFVDTNILIYARGQEHPFKHDCLRAITRMAEEALPAFTNAEVLQELLHRYIGLRRVDVGRQLIGYLVALVPNVLPVTKENALHAARLSADYPRLPARDLLHLAVMLEHGIRAILSTDRHFDDIPMVRRLDPAGF